VRLRSQSSSAGIAGSPCLIQLCTRLFSCGLSLEIGIWSFSLSFSLNTSNRRGKFSECLSISSSESTYVGIIRDRADERHALAKGPWANRCVEIGLVASSVVDQDAADIRYSEEFEFGENWRRFLPKSDGDEPLVLQGTRRATSRIRAISSTSRTRITHIRTRMGACITSFNESNIKPHRV
jgi:hypothetical protein